MPTGAKIFTYAPSSKIDNVLFNIFYPEITGDVIEHGHENCIEITFVANGTAIHHSDGRNVRLHKGDICVTLPEGIHSILQCDHLELFTISCSSDVQNMLGFNLNFLHGMHDLFGGRKKTNIFHLNSAEFFDVARIVSQMNQLQSSRNESELRSYFSVLLCLLTQGYAKSLLTGKRNQELEKILDYINIHYREEIRLSKLAKLSSLSESQLIRQFRNRFNTTPIGYQLELRMTEARRLLRESSLAVSEIAYRLGFSDTNYFSHYFSKKTGQAPREYRQLARQNSLPEISGGS